MELFLENQFSAKTFQDLFQDGTNQLSLEDMLLEINTKPLTMCAINQANFK